MKRLCCARVWVLSVFMSSSGRLEYWRLLGVGWVFDSGGGRCRVRSIMDVPFLQGRAHENPAMLRQSTAGFRSAGSKLAESRRYDKGGVELLCCEAALG